MNFSKLSPQAQCVLRETLEAEFRAFVTYFFWVINGLKFEWNDHHDEIIDALMRCYRHETRVLVINIPPRYSKTEIVVVLFVAWCLAINSKCQFIHLSYSDELATDNSARIKEIIETDEYQAMWNVRFNKDRNAKSLWRTTEGGGLKAGAAGGAVTGFGAGISYNEEGKSPEDSDPTKVPFGGAILIDDPLKIDDAESDVERTKVNKRINTTIKSRRNAPWTPIILVMQRAHDDDPSGFVLNGGIGEKAEHLKIPVLREDGSPLWKFRHNVDDLVAIRVADKFVWNAQYMQEPIPDEGDYFLAENARWYKTRPPNDQLSFYGSSDYAASEDGGDYTEHAIWGIDAHDNVYLVDWWSGQTKSDVWIEEQLDLAAKYSPILTWFGEGGPIKASIEPWLKKRMRERRIHFPLQWQSHSHPNYKSWMARSFQGLWEQNRIYLPEDEEWAHEVLRQLTRFPRGTLDDKVDCCSLFGRGIAKVWTPSVKKEPEPPPTIDTPTGHFDMPGLFETAKEKSW